MQFLDEIKDLLGCELAKSGTAFYSNKATLKKGKYLILGLNPGGDPDIITNTIEQSFSKLDDTQYNAYFEPWLKAGKTHRLQKNLQNLFKYLETDIRSVCATNLFYTRTKREAQLSISNISLYKQILHKTIDLISPEVIFTFGRRPFEVVLDFTEVRIIKSKNINSGHGKWKIILITALYNNACIKIVGLPHLSIYTLYTRDHIMELIKDFTASP